MNLPRIIVFGAGNIGRSFIAPVFTRGGYEVVFADVNPVVLDALKKRSSYSLVEKTDKGDTEHRIKNVRAIDARDSKVLKQELESCDLCVTCVGAAALPAVIRSIGFALTERQRPLDIILAENLKSAGELARSELSDSKVDIGIIETSIGKMVPIMPKDVASRDPLLSWAEPYNTLIVDQNAFRNPVPKIADLKPVSPIEPWVARKLYIHNFGHAAAAYLGFKSDPSISYIWEALKLPGVAEAVRLAMWTSGRALVRDYPETFNDEEIQDHVEDLLSRFSNRALGDTIYRVGRDLKRKLHHSDRVVGAISMVLRHGLDPQPLLEVFTAACDFQARDETGNTDAGDLEVCQMAGDPELFIRTIVGIDQASFPGIYEALRKSWK